MKLNIVPAKRGLTWVHMGMQTFFKKPLPLMAIFFLFMLAVTLLGSVHVIGLVISLIIMPAATAGLIAAGSNAYLNQEVSPRLLFVAFFASNPIRKNMLILGVFYAIGVGLCVAATQWIDDGAIARMYLTGKMSAEAAQQAEFLPALLVFMLSYCVVSMAFWHAPALVLWLQVPPIKSLFFSLVACWRNLGAFCLYALGWFVLIVLVVLLSSLLGMLAGGGSAVSMVILPMTLLLTAMGMYSIHATVRDCFDSSSPTEASGPTPPEEDPTHPEA